MGFVWHTTPERAWGDLAAAYAEAIDDGIHQLAQYYAAQIEAWMKDNASWTDRTGNARQTLHTEVEQLAGGAAEIILAHGMEYGIWLELAYAGRYAIIGPALDTWMPQIWRAVTEMLSD